MKEKLNYKYSLKNVKDYILIAEIKSGKERAFYELFDRYFDKLVYTLLKYNEVRIDEAQDLVTDAFLDFNRQLINGQYKDENKVFGYIYRIVHRKYIGSLKNNKEQTTEDDLLVQLEEEIFTNDIEQEEYYRIAEQAKAKLSFLCQELIEAQYGAIKISDEEIYNEYIEEFTNLANVRNKRNKCMEKLRKNARELINISE